MIGCWFFIVVDCGTIKEIKKEFDKPGIYDSIANEGKMSRKIDKQIVYEYLTAIPNGKVVTYGQIAEFLGNKKPCTHRRKYFA